VPYSHCFINIFNFETRTAEVLDFGPLCYLVAGDWLGVGYFMIYNDWLDPETTLYRREAFREGQIALVRHEAGSDQNEVIYAGAIEDVLAISPDERYAVMRLSNDDTAHVAFPTMNSPKTYFARLDAIDLETDQVLYQPGSEWWGFPHGYWRSAERARFVDNRTWFMDTLYYVPDTKNAVHHIDESTNPPTLMSYRAAYITQVTPDLFGLIDNVEEGGFELTLVNLSDDEQHPIMRFSDQRVAGMTYLGGDQLTVELRGWPEMPYKQSYVFTLRVPELEDTSTSTP
jgi:hypothetical protein